MIDIEVTRADELLIIWLARGKANALNSAMIDELIGAVAEAGTNRDVQCVVLASGRPKFFSSGFDVAEVFAYDRSTMADFFGRFIDLYESLVRLPKPVVGAINGHAFAGGAVLALACDARVMADGPFGFALNEVNLGIVLPPGVLRMAIDAVGPRHARELILAGKTYNPAQSLEAGLADELASPETVVERAMARARELAAKPPRAFAAIKQDFATAADHPKVGTDREFLKTFIDQWFSAESKPLREALSQSMKR